MCAVLSRLLLLLIQMKLYLPFAHEQVTAMCRSHHSLLFYRGKSQACSLSTGSAVSIWQPRSIFTGVKDLAEGPAWDAATLSSMGFEPATFWAQNKTETNWKDIFILKVTTCAHISQSSVPAYLVQGQGEPRGYTRTRGLPWLGCQPFAGHTLNYI